jgi:hypothetical protein
VLFEASSAVKVKLKGVPMVAVAGAITEKWVAAPLVLLTAIELEVPVIEAVTVSVAVMVWAPVVFNVAEKVPVPFVSVVLGGSTAWASVLVKCIVPE